LRGHLQILRTITLHDGLKKACDGHFRVVGRCRQNSRRVTEDSSRNHRAQEKTSNHVPPNPIKFGLSMGRNPPIVLKNPEIVVLENCCVLPV
jgi:hypothetical protein